MDGSQGLYPNPGQVARSQVDNNYSRLPSFPSNYTTPSPTPPPTSTLTKPLQGQSQGLFGSSDPAKATTSSQSPSLKVGPDVSPLKTPDKEGVTLTSPNTYNLGFAAVHGEGDDNVQPEVSKGYENVTLPEHLATDGMTDRKLASYYNQAYPNPKEALAKLQDLKTNGDYSALDQATKSKCHTKINNAIAIIKATHPETEQPSKTDTQKTQGPQGTEKNLDLAKSTRKARTMKTWSKALKVLAVVGAIAGAVAFVGLVIASGGAVGALAIGIGAGVVLGSAFGFGIGSAVLSHFHNKELEKQDMEIAKTGGPNNGNQTEAVKTAHAAIEKFENAYDNAKKYAKETWTSPGGANWETTCKDQLRGGSGLSEQEKTSLEKQSQYLDDLNKRVPMKAMNNAFDEMKTALRALGDVTKYPGLANKVEQLHHKKGVSEAAKTLPEHISKDEKKKRMKPAVDVNQTINDLFG
jgi:hypothetical protein